MLQLTVQGILGGLADPILPVQSAAALSIGRLFDSRGTKELVRPILPQLIQQYFRIIHEIENDSVLRSLQSVVRAFGDEIAPMAAEMVDQLLLSFKSFASVGSQDDDAVFGATQALDTIMLVLEAVEDRNDILEVLEVKLTPFIIDLSYQSSTSYEFLEHWLAMMSYFTYYKDTIASPMWNLCGTILGAAHTWAFDFIGDIAVPLYNFLIKVSHNPGFDFLFVLFVLCSIYLFFCFLLPLV